MSKFVRSERECENCGGDILIFKAGVMCENECWSKSLTELSIEFVESVTGENQ